MNAAAILLLAEKGLSALDIAEVAAAMEVRRDPTAADRMARMRERKRNDVTRNVTANAGSNDIDILTSEKKIPPKAKALAPKPKKHILPLDWQPEPFTPKTMAEQIVQRWEPGRMERELAKFRAHYAATATKWESWQAVWCKWVNNSDDFQRGRNGPTDSMGRHQSDGLSPTTRAANFVFGETPTGDQRRVQGRT